MINSLHTACVRTTGCISIHSGSWFLVPRWMINFAAQQRQPRRAFIYTPAGAEKVIRVFIARIFMFVAWKSRETLVCVLGAISGAAGLFRDGEPAQIESQLIASKTASYFFDVPRKESIRARKAVYTVKYITRLSIQRVNAAREDCYHNFSR